MKTFLALFMVLCAVTESHAADSHTPDFPEIDTSDIAEWTNECTDCIEWELLGICIWLDCNLFGCEIETSFKVGHYIPEYVVSTYTTDTVWENTRDWNDEEPSAEVAWRSRRASNTGLDFKNADVITHPLVLQYNILGQNEFFCRAGEGIPMLPHFLSKSDKEWNSPNIERMFPQSILGYPYINSGDGGLVDTALRGYWAPAYPRCGWGAHPYDPVNAGVAAFRSAAIVTGPPSVHLAIPAGTNCENRCWPPAAVTADDTHDNKWQMLYPELERKKMRFGESLALGGWANGKAENYETYLWSLWRWYECCDDKGMWIGEISFQ